LKPCQATETLYITKLHYRTDRLLTLLSGVIVPLLFTQFNSRQAISPSSAWTGAD